MATIETIYRSPEGREYDGSQSRGSGFSITVMFAWLSQQLERRRSRVALLEMTDDQLKDIGLSRSDADGEGRRRFWD